jgi:hypothetical protein
LRALSAELGREGEGWVMGRGDREFAEGSNPYSRELCIDPEFFSNF